MKKIIRKIKSSIDYKMKYQELQADYKQLLNDIDEKNNKIDTLEFELSKDFQAQKIENQENLINKLREGKKMNAEEIQKERRKRIAAQEEVRKKDDEIKKLEQALRIAKRVGA